jgi:hypothetical protein
VARVLPVIENEGSIISHKAWLSHLQGLLALVNSSFIEAQSAFEVSLDIWHSTYPHHFVSSLTALGLTSFRLGQLPQARRHLVEALANAQKYGSIAPALATFPPIALVLAADGDKAHAVEIWLSAKSFPFIANSKWFDDVAGRELEALVDSLPPDATSGVKARGRELDIWETVRGLLLDLDKHIGP